MLNYIHSELYRTFHRAYTYVLIGVAALLGVLALTLFLPYKNQVDSTLSMYEVLGLCVPIAFFFTYMCETMLSDCAFGDDCKHQTLKNTISYGFTRTQVYLGKLLAQLIVAVLAMVVIYTVLFVAAFVLLGRVDMAVGEVLSWYLGLLLRAFPIWLAGLSILNLLHFVLKDSLVNVTYLGLTVLLPFVLTQFLSRSWAFLQPVLPYLMMNMMTDIAQVSLQWPWIIGLGWTAVTTALGVALFARKEIR